LLFRIKKQKTLGGRKTQRGEVRSLDNPFSANSGKGEEEKNNRGKKEDNASRMMTVGDNLGAGEWGEKKKNWQKRKS